MQWACFAFIVLASQVVTSSEEVAPGATGGETLVDTGHHWQSPEMDTFSAMHETPVLKESQQHDHVIGDDELDNAALLPKEVQPVQDTITPVLLNLNEDEKQVKDTNTRRGQLKEKEDTGRDTSAEIDSSSEVCECAAVSIIDLFIHHP